MASIMAPAQLHATGVAVYPALFPIKLLGKKLKSVFDFLTYSRETGFSFSYEKVVGLLGANEPSNETDRVSKLDNSLAFVPKQNARQQILFAL